MADEVLEGNFLLLATFSLAVNQTVVQHNSLIVLVVRIAMIVLEWMMRYFKRNFFVPGLLKAEKTISVMECLVRNLKRNFFILRMSQNVMMAEKAIIVLPSSYSGSEWDIDLRQSVDTDESSDITDCPGADDKIFRNIFHCLHNLYSLLLLSKLFRSCSL